MKSPRDRSCYEDDYRIEILMSSDSLERNVSIESRSRIGQGRVQYVDISNHYCYPSQAGSVVRANRY